MTKHMHADFTCLQIIIIILNKKKQFEISIIYKKWRFDYFYTKWFLYDKTPSLCNIIALDNKNIQINNSHYIKHSKISQNNDKKNTRRKKIIWKKKSEGLVQKKLINSILVTSEFHSGFVPNLQKLNTNVNFQA